MIDRLNKIENDNKLWINNKSEILLNEYEINEIKKRIIKDENEEINFKLLYKISNNFDLVKDFHDK